MLTSKSQTQKIGINDEIPLILLENFPGLCVWKESTISATIVFSSMMPKITK